MSIGNYSTHLTLGDPFPIHAFYCRRPHKNPLDKIDEGIIVITI